MNHDVIDKLINKNVNNITYAIKNVAERGIISVEAEADVFEELRYRREFKDVIIGEIYESYFLPDRHEFDWQIIQEFVETITDSNTVSFVKEAAGGGILGAVAWEICRRILKAIISTMKKNSLPKSRVIPYKAMLADADTIERFFEAHDSARIDTIEESTNIPRERIYPFLKLMGFVHHRKKHNCLWCKPGVTP